MQAQRADVSNDGDVLPSGRSRRSRRSRFFSPGYVVALLTLIGIATTSTVAASGGINTAARASRVGDRVVVPNELAFPINPLPMCAVLNNYGGYSKTFGATGHQGVDIGAKGGQEVYAVERGILYRQWTDLKSAPGLGWGLHSITDTKYRYFHLSSFAPGLKVGDRVEKGQLIGYVGDTGNATSGGTHLHFEVHPGPEPHTGTVNPVPLFKIPASCTVAKRS